MGHVQSSSVELGALFRRSLVRVMVPVNSLMGTSDERNHQAKREGYSSLVGLVVS